MVSRPSQFDLGAEPAGKTVEAVRWRRFASMALQLVLSALVAVLAGLFVFPLQ